MLLKKIKNKIVNIFVDIKLAVKRFFCPIYLHKNIKIVSPEETLSTITSFLKAEKSGAYFRFGDGEINMIEGKGAIEQDSNSSLGKEMREALELSESNIIKSLMINSPRFGFNEGKHLVSDKWATRLLERSYQFFIGDRIYCHAALAYCFENKRKEIKDLLVEIRKRDSKIFVGNKNMSKEVLERTFGKNVTHLPIEPKNSYKDVDKIENRIVEVLNKNKDEFKIIIFAAGPTSNVLQKRLYGKYNIFSIDFGSLIDAIAGWNSRAWIDADKNYYSEILKQL